MLALEMAAIKASGVDLALTGFDRRELAEIEREMEPPTGDKATGDEPAPAVPENPVTQRGDLWVLGAHRLYCGDATRREDVATLLDGARPHLMVTDPPYGVNYDPGWREDAGISNSDRGEGIMNDHRSDWEPAWRLFGGDVAYVWHAAIYAHVVAASLLKCGFNLRSQIIWAKAQLVIGRGDYHWQHETCFYVVRDGEVGHWNGARDQVTLWRERDFPETRWQGGDKESTVWEIGPPEEDEIRTRHCTQKPLECMRRPIRNNSLPKDAVYEPFAGSGTTLIACEELDRVCYAMELDPGYCDVVVQRWERYTGKKAERVVAEQ
jgi:DNA modification methylase